ncbi:MAG: hypothetical protein HP030_04375 [Ruminococcus sp.]|nr:hypothetical protein [Ruminococcus sp.]HAI78172.1 hypothetical protein [Ruminococcus sp.]HBD71901.1 hypothetical protein [Ruminococcus sp.]HCW12664.1 hypothetical protein [Ruminococcus sp.]
MRRKIRSTLNLSELHKNKSSRSSEYPTACCCCFYEKNKPPCRHAAHKTKLK